MAAQAVWVDTHCHWDAPELADQAAARRGLARSRGVALSVVPAVSVQTFGAVRAWAHAHGDAYALGIHPLYVLQARDDDLEALEAALRAHIDDPRLVAVGEIGLDAWSPTMRDPDVWARQQRFFRLQLGLAKRFDLPVILHVRRAVDPVLKGLRDLGVKQGIAHAFSGSWEQAQAMSQQGMKLGFGGAMTFDTAHRLRGLLQRLPNDAVVMETDGPDIPPQWLYVTQEDRAFGVPQGINASDELPRIGEVGAQLRAQSTVDWARHTTANALAALPRLASCLDEESHGFRYP